MRGDRADQDRGSWLDVVVAAAEMNGQCASNTGSYRRYSRAWMNTGELDGIRVKLGPVAGGLRDVEVNGTVADETK